MLLFHAQPDHSAPQPKTFEIIARQFLAGIAVALGRHGRAVPSIETPFKGRAWTDSTERELNDRIANHRPGRF